MWGGDNRAVQLFIPEARSPVPATGHSSRWRAQPLPRMLYPKEVQYLEGCEEPQHPKGQGTAEHSAMWCSYAAQ